MRIPLTLVLSAVVTLGAAGTTLPATPARAGVPNVADQTATASDVLLVGQVKDGTSGVPLAGAQVAIQELGIGTVTGRLGRYLIRIPEGRAGQEELTVQVDLIGYTRTTHTVRPSEAIDGVVTLDFSMHSTGLRLQEMVVTGVTGQGSRTRADVATGRPMPAVRGPIQTAVAAVNLPPGHPVAPSPRFNREQYAHIEENGFRAALDAPLSTFSIDVDRASYSNVRRFLVRENQTPPIDAVQIEEMVNYFPYRYDLPEGDEPVAVTTELGFAPWREGHQLLRVGVATRPVETEDLPPANLVFLIDVSGSMQSPDKLALVKRSLRLLVGELRPQDRVSMVVYAGAAGLVLEPTSGAEKSVILEALDRLEAGGSTAGGQGLRLAYDVVRRNFIEGGNNRVILASDGDFNVGESSDAAMVRLVEERREEGAFLTILGFGTGNLQATKMQEMAQHGNGNYAYIDGLREARKVLVGEMGGTILTVAKDVKIQVEFNPARVQSYRLIGYENRLLANEDFNDDTKDAGEIGAGHTVTALYEIVPVGSRSGVGRPSVDPLRYQTPVTRDRPEPSGELAFVKVRYKDPDGTESRLVSEAVEADPTAHPSIDLRFASAVAGFGMLLRDSEHRGSIDAPTILDLAGSAIGQDLGRYRREFLDLVRIHQLLTDGPWTEGGER